MTEKIWSLQEIREAYVQILAAYDELFPLYPATKRGNEDITDNFGKKNESLSETIRIKAEEIAPKLKQAADQSGSAVTWRYGDPLDGLNQSLKERIEKALKLGI